MKNRLIDGFVIFFHYKRKYENLEFKIQLDQIIKDIVFCKNIIKNEIDTDTLILY